MTAKELIELLSQYPADTRVVVAGYEGGYNDISVIENIRLRLNAHKDWWYGQHEDTKDENAEPALSLVGTNKIAKD